MQSTTSTSTHEAHPFNTVHRRQLSSSIDLQDSNVAGRPFAFVPKRRSSSGNVTGHILSEDRNASTSTPQGQIRLVEETASEDSASSQTTPRSFCPFPRAKPEQSRGRASESEADSPPDMNKSRTSVISEPAPATVPSGPSSAFLLRKKSGELVKPSLKSTGFATWAVSSSGRARTKSAPTTPMGSKSVHFDAHLEHVKLFLAEQKPLAVSRDGSPTETSEGDATDTAFPFPRINSNTLRLKSILLPPPPSEPWTFDVRLEKLALENTALLGQVIVRNVAFVKWVAVRFTLDQWQTTSEVAARHIATLHDNSFDRFEFRIRLADYMHGIEFKKLFLCVRYTTEGKEMWDSNGGRNYEVGFEKVREDQSRQAHASSPFGGRNGPPSVADLRKQLEQVAQKVGGDGSPHAPTLNRRKPRGLRVWLGDHLLGDDDDDPTPPLRPHSRSPSPLDEQKKASGTPSLSNKEVPLSARYDFGASLRSPTWTPPVVHTKPPTPIPTTSRSNITQRLAKSPPKHTSTLTTAAQSPRMGHHRRSITSPSNGSPTDRPRKNYMQGSPRDSTDFADEGMEERCLSQGDDTFDEDRPRHHTRAWARSSSFEQIAADTSTLKKTPPGMPRVIPPTPPRGGPEFHLSGEESSSSSSCSPSVSPSTSREPLDNVWQALHGSEDENTISTPSITTSSSPPTSLSPLSLHGELPRAASDDSLTTATTPRRSGAQRPPINSSPYYSFLDQFCFFTGVTTYYNHSNNTPDGTPPRRVQSASTVEDYFSLSPQPNDVIQTSLSTAGSSPSRSITRMRPPISADISPSRGLTTSS